MKLVDSRAILYEGRCPVDALRHTLDRVNTINDSLKADALSTSLIEA